MKQDVVPVSLKVEPVMYKALVYLIVLVASNMVYAQDIAVGTWRTHNSYNRLIGLTSADDVIYAAGSSALFKYDPANGALDPITSLTGLSDTDITSIGFNPGTNQLIVSYRNGNIDIIKDNKIINITALLNADINTSKVVNHIYSSNEYCYLSADFGVLVLNMATLQVKDTYFELGSTGQTLKINAATIKNDSLYLATTEGVIRGSLKDNLKDFNQWLRYDSSDGIPQTEAKIVLSTPSGLITTIDNQGIFEWNESGWEEKAVLLNESFLFGDQYIDRSILTTENGVFVYQEGIANQVTSNLLGAPKAAIAHLGTLMVADGINGVVIPDQNLNVYPNGPFENQIVNLFSYLNKVIAMPPAYTSSYQPLRSNAGFSQFSEGEWENFNSSNYPNTTSIPEFLDITDAMYSYATKKLFLSSFGYGIMEIDGDAITIFNENNSSLVNSGPTANDTYVTCLDANASGLSAINFNASEALNLYTIDEQLWESNGVPSPAANAVQLLSFNNNSFWMRVPRTLGGGIMVYDRTGQRDLYLNTDYLLSNGVNDIALDLEGKMWIATDLGIVYLYNAENILDQGNIDLVEPIFEGNILFRNEKITALAVDGGNRIWMGTSSGLWLFSNDGQELVEHFEAGESPLPSNNILKIAINHENGEVFIATDKGLVSYRGTSTITGIQNPVKIFPNPVIAAENDIVTIEGVSTNANLWITDSSGRLVYRTIANGSTATWSGISSLSLSSGVYFVFITGDDGEEKQIGKIAVIN